MTGLDQAQYEVPHFDPRDDLLRFNLDENEFFRFLSLQAFPPGRYLDTDGWFRQG